MKCPNCGSERQQGAIDCMGCGIVFEKWQKRQAEKELAAMNAAVAAPAISAGTIGGSASPAAPPDQEISGLARVAVLLAAAAISYHLYVPGKGGEIAGNANRNEKRGFAFVPPEGWELSNAEECNEKGMCIVVQATKKEESGINATIQVLVAPAPGAFKFDSEREKEVSEAFVAGIKPHLDKVETPSTETLDIDGLSSMKIEAAATKHIKREVRPAVYTPAPPQINRAYAQPRAAVMPAVYDEMDLELMVGGLTIPGKKNIYQIIYMFDKSLRSNYISSIDGFISSFRVLKRPAPIDYFGVIMRDAIHGGLFGLFSFVFFPNWIKRKK